MTLQNQIKLSKHIFRLLKVNEITFPIGRTSKGNLGIVLTTNNEDFQIMLDSVPLSTKSALEDDNNIELKKVLEKYLFEQEPTTAGSYFRGVRISHGQDGTSTVTADPMKLKWVSGKRGRPVGSKNAKKTK